MVVLHSVLHDRQAKAGATGLFGMTLIDTIETLKYLVQMFGGNADAGVTDADMHSTMLLGNRNLYMTTRIVILNRIVAEIVWLL